MQAKDIMLSDLSKLYDDIHRLSVSLKEIIDASGNDITFKLAKQQAECTALKSQIEQLKQDIKSNKEIENSIIKTRYSKINNKYASINKALILELPKIQIPANPPASSLDAARALADAMKNLRAARALADAMKNLRAAVNPASSTTNKKNVIQPLSAQQQLYEHSLRQEDKKAIIGQPMIQADALSIVDPLEALGKVVRLAGERMQPSTVNKPEHTFITTTTPKAKGEVITPITTTSRTPVTNTKLFRKYKAPSIDERTKTVEATHKTLVVPTKILEIAEIAIPTVPTTLNVHTDESSYIIKPESAADKKWAEIRLKAIGSKWDKGEAWEHKKLSKEARKPMTEEQINAKVIAVSIEKLQHLLTTDKNKEKYTSRQNADSTDALDAKINLYVAKGWDSASKEEEKNVLTISQNNVAIFEVRPGENKIQFLIPNPTTEQRVAGFEMFQQMCRIKGNAAEVKINCNNPSIKAEFEKNATTAKITPVDDFTNKPSTNKPGLS